MRIGCTIDKGLSTPSECRSKTEKHQRISKKDQRISDKHQRKFSLSHFTFRTLFAVTGSRISQMEGHQPLSLEKKPIILQDFAENCMKMKEIDREVGTRP